MIMIHAVSITTDQLMLEGERLAYGVDGDDVDGHQCNVFHTLLLNY